MWEQKLLVPKMYKLLATLLLVASSSWATTRSVTTYGAVGDGTTNNNTALTNAFAACASGDTTTFPVGTFLITATQLIPNGCTVTSSAGAILKGTFQPLLWTVANNAANVTLSGMTLDGGGIIIRAGSSATAAQNILITGNTFQNIVRTPNEPPDNLTVGVYAPHGMDNSTISSNTFLKIYDANAILPYDPNNIPASPSDYPAVSEVCAAIWVYDSDTITITANNFGQSTNYANGTCQALHYTSRELGHSGLTLTYNNNWYSSRHGYEIQGDFRYDNVIVDHNYYALPAVHVNGQMGISLAIGGSNHQITNNSMQGPNQVNPSPHQSASFEVEGCYNLTSCVLLVQGNTSGHWDTAQLSGWNSGGSGWSTINNTWCDITTAVVAIEMNGSSPTTNTGNTNTSSCSGVTFPPPYTPTPSAPPLGPSTITGRQIIHP